MKKDNTKRANIKKIFMKSWKQSLMGFWTNVPILLGVILLISIFQQYLSFDFLTHIDNQFLAAFVANVLWSISTGNPINSYIIAIGIGNLGLYTFIISVFLITWVTVGIVQLPAESFYFGKKYAITRNLLAFIFAFVWGYLIYLLYILL